MAELLPGQAKKDITTGQAKTMLATVRPRDIAGKTRRRIAAEELAELVAVEAKIKKSTAELKAIVLERGSHLMDLRGVGPVAARVLADVGDVTRFADRNRFASWTGTAPLDASSGEHSRHRLSLAGNRRMRRISDAIFRQLVADAAASRSKAVEAGPGGHRGASLQSSAAGSHPHTDTSDQPRLGPAALTLRRTVTPLKRHLERTS
ncbi:IS110 family transposase [Pedococcus bigeumensis]|uniref:IS110 family transposase n=1 Tax=Pedococcus bigeumensis TaxID=433644 RepID=UPI002FE9B1B3